MSNAFDIDTDDVQDLLHQLDLYAGKAMPFAIRNGLNSTAFAAQAEWRGEMRKKLILRNQFTARSVRVKKTREFKISRMEAITGSDADFAERIELGGKINATGKFGVPIPTPDARVSKSKKKVVSRPNKLANIQLRDRSRGGGKRARNRKAITSALRSGDHFAFLELTNGRSGIFSIEGAGESLRVRMIWDMSRSRRTVTTPKHPTMQPAMRAIGPAIPAIYAQAILEQLRRHTKLGFR